MLTKDRIRREEEKEKVEAMGAESEIKGKKAVLEVEKEVALKKKKKEEDQLNALDMKRKMAGEYCRQLVFMLHDMVLEALIPTPYQWGVWYDGRGIRLTLVDKFGRRHNKAFIPSFYPKFDLNSCSRFALWIEDTYDAIEGKLQNVYGN